MLKDEKDTLRAFYLQKRRTLDIGSVKEKSDRIVGHLIRWLNSQKFNQIFLFLPLRGEPNIVGLTQTKDLSIHPMFAVPVACMNKEMEFFPWRLGDPLVKGLHQISVPKIQNQSLAANSRTLILVPALAAGRDGGRLGFGGGYYDRYLSENKGLISCAILFSEFLNHNLPQEPWDISMHNYCTEDGCFQIDRNLTK